MALQSNLAGGGPFLMPLVIVIVTMYSLVTLDHYDGTKEGLFDG